jgi:hypothetical protein
MNWRRKLFLYFRSIFFHALKECLTCCKILHGADGFTFPPKEGVLRIFIVLKIYRPRRVLTRERWVQWQDAKHYIHHRRQRVCMILLVQAGYQYWKN